MTDPSPRQPLISVLIPCYNGASFVSQAIESALSQSYPNVEVVVVDDGSIDDSVRVLESWGEQIVFEAAPNRGACAARNRALELSRGVYLQYLDADDLLLPHKIERQLPTLLANQHDIVFCHGYIFGDGKPERKKQSVIPNPDGWDPFAYCLRQGLATEGPLIRRSLVERVGGFTVGLPRAQEWDFHVRLAAAGGRLSYLPEYLYRHRHDDRADRITQRVVPAGAFTAHLISLAEQLIGNSVYDFNATRRKAFADRLAVFAIGDLRSGHMEIAKQGLALAKELAPDFSVPGGRLQQLCTSLLGPLLTEKLRSLWVSRRRQRPDVSAPHAKS